MILPVTKRLLRCARAALARRRMRPVLVFEGDHATLWRPAMDGGRAVMVESARIPLAGDPAAVAAAGQAAFAPMTMTRIAYGGAQEYYVASAADRIVLMPGGQLDLTGVATYELFFRGTLDKLGVTDH